MNLVRLLKELREKELRNSEKIHIQRGGGVRGRQNEAVDSAVERCELRRVISPLWASVSWLADEDDAPYMAAVVRAK